MDKLFSIMQIIAPIVLAVFFGALARKKQLLTPEENQGLQSFVIKFGLPCIIFKSCLTADIGMESLTSMAMIIPFVLISSLWSYAARKKRFPYYNMPMLFSAQETGMLGLPLFMLLFGADQAYRMGVLDLSQALICYPTIAILSAPANTNPSPKQIIKSIVTSPFVIVSLLGLGLNLSGIRAWMESVGFGGIILESAGFLGQPVSALMIFSVGYNFSLAKDCRATIFKISAIHFLWFAFAGAAIQGLLCLIPNVDPLTRWVLLLYTVLPTSYQATSFGRTEEDKTMASGVCSVLTAVTLVICCIMAAFAA